MQHFPQILIHHLSYSLSNNKPIFKQLDLALTVKKIGLVGCNGIGKSTLLKLMAHHIPSPI